MKKEQIISQYCEHKKTLRAIGREFNVCHETIKRNLLLWGVELRSSWSRKKIETKCSYCQKPITRFPSTSSNRNFCCHECYYSWMVGNTTGENSINWKGGITAISSNNLKTPEFRALKEIVLQRFPFCVMCGDDNYRHVHHIKTRREFPELAFEETNLITLCRSCHSRIKGKEKAWEAYLTRIVCKGEELRENLKAGSAHGNPQASLSNVISLVDRKLQRLTVEDTQANKTDTRIAPERDEIVRACSKE